MHRGAQEGHKGVAVLLGIQKGHRGAAALRGALRQCAWERGRGRCKARAAGALLVKWEALLGPANARGGVPRAQGAVM